MDSLTQIVLGAAVGEATLGRKVGNRAMLWGAVAGTIPDLDVFIRLFTDPISATELHRGVSHSLIFSILMAPVLGYLVRKWPKMTLGGFAVIVFGYPFFTVQSWLIKLVILALLSGVLLLINRRKISNGEPTTAWDWNKLFFWSLVTHPLLDAHTTWGTQFFWPFDLRLAYKNIFVADPLYTVPFLVCLLIALFMKRTNPKRRKFNNAGLIISTTYMALTFVFKGMGISVFSESLKEQGIEYVEMDTKPTPLNTFLWNAQIETKNGYLVGYYSIFDESGKVEFSKELPKNHHLLDPIRDQKVVQQLIHIAQGWYIVEDADSCLVFTDLRFGQLGMSNEAPFIWRYLLFEEENGEITVTRPPAEIHDGVGAMFADLATRISGK